MMTKRRNKIKIKSLFSTLPNSRHWIEGHDYHGHGAFFVGPIGPDGPQKEAQRHCKHLLQD